MTRYAAIVISLLFILAATGCFIRPRNLPVAPMPLTTLTANGATATVPRVITATFTPGTGETTPNPPGDAGTSTPAVTAGPSLAPTAVTSSVTSLLVKDDVRLRRGPGATYDILGLVHAGMTLKVTGKSVDDAWWQVTCDQGVNNICWVSADPELTEPVQTPP